MPLKLVFMGTPDFAVPCLERLLADGHTVSAVFTQPDKPRGRGQKLSPSPVKALALEKNIPVHQPTTLRDGKAFELLKELAPDAIIVVAYGKLLPKEILELPPLGCLNVHASLLPRWRGAAPIQWSIIAGDKKTGVTIMRMDEGMDTGDILQTAETPIAPGETAGDLFKRLSPMGADLLSDTLSKLSCEDGCCCVCQDDGCATHAPMLNKELGELDFERTANELCCLIRGVSPAPGAFFYSIKGKVKVLCAKPLAEYSGKPGTILDEKRCIVACGQGALELSSVRPEGKPAMEGAAFLRGLRLGKGEKLTQDSHPEP